MGCIIALQSGCQRCCLFFSYWNSGRQKRHFSSGCQIAALILLHLSLLLNTIASFAFLFWFIQDLTNYDSIADSLIYIKLFLLMLELQLLVCVFLSRQISYYQVTLCSYIKQSQFSETYVGFSVSKMKALICFQNKRQINRMETNHFCPIFITRD